MNYLDEAKQRLQDHAAKRFGISSLKAEISRLEDLIELLPDLAPGEAQLLFPFDCVGKNPITNCKALVIELKENLVATQKQVDKIDAALDKLDDYDRMIVDRLFINHERVVELAAEMYVCDRTIFMHRDRALRRFALAYYGIEE